MATVKKPPRPSAEQAARVLQVAQLVQELAPEELSESACVNWGFHARHVREEEVEAQLLPLLLERLRDAAPQALADYFCFPSVHQAAQRDLQARMLQRLGCTAAFAYLDKHPSAYVERMLLDRVHALLHLGAAWQERPDDDPELQEQRSRLYGGGQLQDGRLARFPPDLNDCLVLLFRRPASEELLGILQDLVAGRWPHTMPQDPLANDVPDWRRIVFRLHAHGRIDEAGLEGALQRIGIGVNHHGLLEIACESGNPAEAVEEPQASVEAVTAWSFRALDRYLSAVDPADDEFSAIWGWDLNDYRWPLAALRQYRRLELDAKSLRAERKHYGLVNRLDQCFKLRAYAPGQDEDGFVAALGEFPHDMLLLGLSCTSPLARRAFLRALGWDDLLPWLDFEPQRHRIEQDMEEGQDAAATPAEAATAPVRPQAFPRQQMRALFAATDPEHRKAYQQHAEANAFPVYEALEGSNRAALEKSIAKGSQAAIRQFGLLPAASEAALLEQYLLLRRVYKEAKQYGAERAANTRRAALVGLANLAVSAGYESPSELEWEMEGRVADSAAAAQGPQAVGGWTISLAVEEGAPRIVVSKAGKRLASVPPAVRKSPEYQALREQQEQAQEQVQRFRHGLETLMCGARPLDARRLALLRRIPAAWGLLQQLVLRGADGTLGLPDVQGEGLLSVDGKPVPLVAPFTIAHVYDLFAARQLSGWQRRIASEQRVQPFKQAFRELYVLTPAEEAAGCDSLRFAGHRVRGAVAARLLGQRGWQTSRDDSGLCSRYDAPSGLNACFEFEGVGHYMGEQGIDPLESGSIRFLRGEIVSRLFRGLPPPLPLKEVPPILFSETFRDADLVVSVAQVPDAEAQVSAETFTSRAAVVQAVAQALRLDGVRCEGHFAFVKGRRAEYRVHLGSAAIHIMPGNYLCIVPEQPAGGGFYLPFADSDRKLSEVISKILLLCRDDAINDPTITRQIDAALGKPG
jgi:hypothetical protein